MGVADVSMYILDLRQVLLGHLDQLCRHSLLCELGGAVVLGGGVLIVLPILLEKETQRALQNPYRRGRHSPPLLSQLDLKTLKSPSPNHWPTLASPLVPAAAAAVEGVDSGAKRHGAVT